MVLCCSPWKVLFNSHLVFNIRNFPYEAIVNKSEKVGMSQIQTPPYNSVPWKGQTSKPKKDRKSRSLLFCSPWKVLFNGHLVFGQRLQYGTKSCGMGSFSVRPFVCPFPPSGPSSQAWGPDSQAWGPASQAWGPASQAWGHCSQPCLKVSPFYRTLSPNQATAQKGQKWLKWQKWQI